MLNWENNCRKKGFSADLVIIAVLILQERFPGGYFYLFELLMRSRFQIFYLGKFENDETPGTCFWYFTSSFQTRKLGILTLKCNRGA